MSSPAVSRSPSSAPSAVRWGWRILMTVSAVLVAAVGVVFTQQGRQDGP